MPEKRQNDNIGHLGNTWLNEVKNIRAMAKEQHGDSADNSQKTETPKDEELFAGQVNTQEALTDEEVFAGQVYETPSPQQLFAGDEKFYKSLKKTQPARISMPSMPSMPSVPSVAESIPTFIAANKRFSLIQKSLAAAIFLIAAIMLYAYLNLPSRPVADQPPQADSPLAVTPEKTPTAEPSVAKSKLAVSKPIAPEPLTHPKAKLDSTTPLSLKVAQTHYLNGNYEQAWLVYGNLLQNLSQNPKEYLIRDSLQLQIALCMLKTGDHILADQTLRSLFNSKSPAIRVLANYHSGLREMQNKQYLNARTKAYRAIALIDAIEFDEAWSSALKRNCYFLAGETVTRKVLSLCDADKDIPESLWAQFDTLDEPFTKLNEAQLRYFLNSGKQLLSQTVISPQIQQLDKQGSQSQYSILCNGAPVEELLTRFAANSNLDLHWQLSSDEIGIRKRQIYAYYLPATIQQFGTIAGSAGLMAKIDEKNVVSIFNPATYSYSSEHIALLSEEATLLWQKYLLWFPQDQRGANIHFSLGLLHASNNRVNESVAEYKMIANRFSISSLAPHALLNSSKLKESLHDYTGVRMDLKQLVEQYPDTEISGTAYLHLANNCAEANLKTEAIKLYRKVYYISMSPQTQGTAALEIGKCSYEMGDYETSKKWMERYFELGQSTARKDVYTAYFILGKTYLALNDDKAASEAFQYALQGGPTHLSKEEYTEAISSMVETYMQQEQFVKALEILENIHTAVLTPAESTRIILLKSKAFRAIGLIDKAIAELAPKVDYTNDPVLKSQICFELSQCHIEKGNFTLAHKKLTEILMFAEPGAMTHEVIYELADVCLKLGRDGQAVDICLQLLDLKPSDQIRQKTLDLMAMAYNNQEDYNNAALALLDSNK